MKKIYLNFTTKIMLMVLVPITIALLALGISSYSITQKNMVVQEHNNLKSIVLSVKEMYKSGTLTEDVLEMYDGVEITIFDNDTVIQSSIDGAVGSVLDKIVYRELCGNSEYKSSNTIINGEEYFSYYSLLRTRDELKVFFAGKPTQDVVDEVNRSTNSSMAVSAIIVIIAAIINLLILRTIKSNIKLSTDLIDQLSDGNLLVTVDAETSNDEIGRMYRNCGSLSGILKTSITEINKDSNKLNSMSKRFTSICKSSLDNSKEINIAIDQIANGSSDQANSIVAITKDMSNTNEKIDKIKVMADDLNELSKNMSGIKDVVLSEMKDLKIATDKTDTELFDVNDKVEKTFESIQTIQKTIDIINRISDQTRLLALNASIEAARAGDAGRGFAVVATEVGALAGECGRASEDIFRVLKDLVNNYNGVRQSVTGLSDIIESQSNTINSVVNQFNTLDSNIKSVSSNVEEVKILSNVAKDLSNSVLDNVCNLSAISQESVASTEQTANATAELNKNIDNIAKDAEILAEISEKLITSVEFFKL